MRILQRNDHRRLVAEELERRIVLTQQLGAAVEVDIQLAGETSLPSSVQFRDESVVFQHSSQDLSRQEIDALMDSVGQWVPSEAEARHDLDGTRYWRKSPSSFGPEITQDGIICR